MPDGSLPRSTDSMTLRIPVDATTYIRCPHWSEANDICCASDAGRDGATTDGLPSKRWNSAAEGITSAISGVAERKRPASPVWIRMQGVNAAMCFLYALRLPCCRSPPTAAWTNPARQVRLCLSISSGVGILCWPTTMPAGSCISVGTHACVYADTAETDLLQFKGLQISFLDTCAARALTLLPKRKQSPGRRRSASAGATAAWTRRESPVARWQLPSRGNSRTSSGTSSAR